MECGSLLPLFAARACPGVLLAFATSAIGLFWAACCYIWVSELKGKAILEEKEGS
jgi:hypothetical protein